MSIAFPIASSRTRLRILTIDRAAVTIALVAGAIASYTARFTIDADGMSYLDYSDRFLNGTWLTTPNGYWSPGYPALLAVLRRIIGTGPPGDVPALRIGFLLGYIVSVAGFALLLRTLRQRDADARSPATGSAIVSVAGWALFLWAFLDLTKLDHTTPDSWVAAATYWATAAALLVASREREWPAAIGLGVALGLGYLIKTIMLPVGVLLVLTLLVVQLARRQTVKPTLVAGLVFALVSLPQIVVQSRLAGGPSIGRVGSLVHAWYVSDVPCPLFGVPPAKDTWPTCIQPRGDDAEPISPQPIPRLTVDPSVYVFHNPPEATFAAWYDATQWYPHLHPAMSWHRQIVELVKNAAVDWRVLTPFVIAVVALMLALRARPARFSEVEPLLVIPSLGTLGAYALSFSSARYLGPAFALLLLGFARVSLRPAPEAGHSARGAGVPRLALGLAAAAMVMLVNSGFEMLDEAFYSARHIPNVAMDRAHAVAAAGVARGTRVGIIGDGSNAYWARLDRLHIVAEIHQTEGSRYFFNTRAKQDSIVAAFAAAGARAIIADPAPDLPARLPPGWVRLPGQSALAVLRL